MGSTKRDRTQPRIADKVYNEAKANAAAFERVTTEFQRVQALIHANLAERASRGEEIVPREPPFVLASFLEEFVKDAVRRGDVYYDAETGYAAVRKREAGPFPCVGEEGWGTAEWEAESHRRWELQTYEQNLAHALEHPRLHALALLWLDAPHEDVGAMIWHGATERARDFALVAGGVRGVPPPVLARVRDGAPKVPALFYSEPLPANPIYVHAWENGLVLGIWTAATNYPKVPEARDRVTLVLEMMIASVGGMMPEGVARKFREPSSMSLTRAVNLMKGLRLRGMRPEFLPPDAGRGAGAPKSEWGAARDFARCFNVPFPDKVSKLSRRK